MSSWNEDRKFVLETLKRIDGRVEKLSESHWRLSAKVAGLAALMGLLGGAITKLF